MNSTLSHVHKGFGVVRPYLHGPVDLPEFLQSTFNAVEVERNEGGPTLLQIGDSLLWVEAGDLPPHVSPWVGSIYVYVQDVDAVYDRAIQLGAKSISPPEDKPYNERQAGFFDPGGNSWWVSTYKQMQANPEFTARVIACPPEISASVTHDFHSGPFTRFPEVY